MPEPQQIKTWYDSLLNSNQSSPLTLWISVVGIVGAICNFFYSRHLFQSKEFPLILDVTTQNNPYSPITTFGFENKTKIPATDVSVKLEIFLGLTKFEQSHFIGKVPELGEFQVEFTPAIQFALAKGFENRFTLEKTTFGRMQKINLLCKDHVPLQIRVRTSVQYTPSMNTRKVIRKKCKYRVTYALVEFQDRGEDRGAEYWNIISTKSRFLPISLRKTTVTDSAIKSLVVASSSTVNRSVLPKVTFTHEG